MDSPASSPDSPKEEPNTEVSTNVHVDRHPDPETGETAAHQVKAVVGSDEHHMSHLTPLEKAKPPFLIALLVLLIAAGAFGASYVNNSSTKQEAQVGTDYVAALNSKNYSAVSGQSINSTSDAKVTKLDDSGNKYAYVTYDSSTLLETYQDGAPKVITVQKGAQSYTPDKLKSKYDSYKQQVSQMDTLVDHLAKNSGDNSKAIIGQLFKDN
jgi:hypothetical protein